MKFTVDKIIEISIFIVLIILSGLFYVERTVILDMAFLLFNILKTDELAIQNNRFIAALPQAIPLLCSKLGLSLQWIMIFFSMSFVTLNALYYVLLKYLIKSQKMALVLVIMQFFVVTHTFYWIQSELLQATSLAILFYGLVVKLDFSKNNIFNYYLLLFVLIFALVYAHYAVIFPIGFMVVYFLLLDYKKYKYTIPVFICFLVIYILKLKFITTHSYDISALGRTDNLRLFFPNYLKLDSFSRFMNFLIEDYYLLGVGFISLIVFYIWKKRYLLLSYYLISSLGYLIIINVLFYDSENQFYVESFYISLGLMTIIPLVYEVFPLMNYKWLYYSLGIVFIIRVADISTTRPIYTDRINYLTKTMNTLDENKQDKIIFKTSNEAREALMLTWASSYEFWLLSTLKLGKTKSIYYSEDTNKHLWMLNNKKKFLSNWGVFEYSDFSDKYFIFTDTTSYYTIID